MQTRKFVSVSDFVPPLEKLLSYSENESATVDRQMSYFFFGYFFFGIFLSYFHMRWDLGVFLGGSLLVAFLLLKKYSTNSESNRYFVSFFFGIFVIQFLIQMEGAFYFHFIIFITMSLLVLYQKWLVLLPFTFIVGFYCLLSYILLTVGYDGPKKYFLNVERIDGELLVFGSLLGVFHFFICLFFANSLSQKSFKDARNMIYLNDQLNLAENTQLANEIAKGVLDQQFTPSDNDIIGQALLDMRNNLKMFVENERDNKWKSDGVAKISDVLMNANTVNSLCKDVLYQTVKYINAQQGAIFLLEIQDDKELLVPINFYAPDSLERTKTVFEKGEGLIGQVANSLKMIYLEDLPETFFRVKSFSGDSVPRSVIIIPLKLKDQLVGVLEIASLNKLRDFERSFLDDVAERIASTILATRSNENNEKLLSETQAFAMQSRVHEELMRQNVEELQSTQEQLAKQNAAVELAKNELSAQIKAINKTALLVELNLDGLIIYANENFITSSKYNLKSLLNHDFTEFIDKDNFEYAWFTSFSNSKLDIVGHSELRCLDAFGVPYWLEITLTAVKDENEKIQKIILLAFDVSQRIFQEEQLQKYLQELETAKTEATAANNLASQQLNAIDRSIAMIEMSVSGDISVANAKASKIFAYEEHELKKMNFKKLTPSYIADSQVYEDFWGNLMLGRSFEGEFECIDKKGATKWIKAGFNAVYDLQDNVSNVISLFYDITSEVRQKAEMSRAIDLLTEKESQLQENIRRMADIQDELDAKSQELTHFISAINHSLAMIVFDANKFIIDINDKMCTLLGYKSQDLLGKEHRVYVPDEQIEDGTYHGLWTEIGKGKYFERTVSRQTKERGIVWLLVFYIPMLDENNQVQKVISFYSDVTEEVMHKQKINELLEDYKKVNDELKRTQKSMITDSIIEKLLLEHLSCVFKFKNDAALTPILLSTGIKDLTGIDASEFLESKISLEQLIFPLDKKLTEQRKKVRKNLKDGQTYKLVYAVKKPDESIITISEYGKGSFDKTGKLVFIEGFLTLKDDNMFL